MVAPLTESAPVGFLGPDPGRSIRVWVTLLLRLGIGLTLLSTGLAGYFGMRGGGFGGGPWARGGSYSMLDPFMSGLPYLAIGLGLALILGFLTTASAIAAGFFSLMLPIFAIVQIVTMGPSGAPGFGGRFVNDQFLSTLMAMSLPSLLTNAAMIWLSPLENNPYSVDALIFGRNEMEPIMPRPEPSPAHGPVVEAEQEAPLEIGE